MVLRSERESRVWRLTRDGWSLSAIAARIGCSVPTVAADLQRILARLTAEESRTAEQDRAIIGARLEDGRRRLSRIATGKDATVSERIAAERAMAAIEEQRARLLGLRKEGDAGDSLQAFVAALVSARQDGIGHGPAPVVDAELADAAPWPALDAPESAEPDNRPLPPLPPRRTQARPAAASPARKPQAAAHNDGIQHGSRSLSSILATPEPAAPPRPQRTRRSTEPQPLDPRTAAQQARRAAHDSLAADKG